MFLCSLYMSIQLFASPRSQNPTGSPNTQEFLACSVCCTNTGSVAGESAGPQRGQTQRFMAPRWARQKALLVMWERANKGEHIDIFLMEGNAKMSMEMSHLDFHHDHFK